jgi:hypothetical protein
LLTPFSFFVNRVAPFFIHDKHQAKNISIETNEAALNFVINLNIDNVIDECCAAGIDLRALLLGTGTNSKSIPDLILEVRESCQRCRFQRRPGVHEQSGFWSANKFASFA